MIVLKIEKVNTFKGSRTDGTRKQMAHVSTLKVFVIIIMTMLLLRVTSSLSPISFFERGCAVNQLPLISIKKEEEN